MTDQPQYGAYPDPNLPPRSDGTAVTNPATDVLGFSPAPQPPASKKKRHTGLLVGIAVLIAALAVGGYFLLRSTGTNGPAAATPAATTKAPTKIEAAANKCYLPGTDPTDLGHTLTLRNVAAKEDAGPVSMDDMQCVFRELDVPQSVLDHIGQTRAMDGMQSDSWEGMSVRWNYHPDSGVNITFTEAK